MKSFLMAALTNARIVGALSALVIVGIEGTAHATNVTEFPDNGSEQMARGGAWVARASDPLAAFYNPAGLAGQNTRLTLQMNLNFGHTCFTRQKSAFDTSQEPLADSNGVFPRVCNDVAPFPNPQIAFTYRVTDRIGAAIAILGPSGVGTSTWPRFVNDGQGQPQPSPNRYLMTDGNTFFLTPTVAVGAEIIDGLRLGASLQWGIAKAKLASGAPAVNQDNANPRGNDVESTIIASDYFVPGFTLGALYSPTDFFDVAGWYKWSDSIKARGDAYTQANYYQPAVAAGNISGIKDGDTSQANCNFNDSTTACGNGNNAFLHLAVPMEAKLGFRFHKPRHKMVETDPNTGIIKKSHSRDPIADDIFDVELDGTWANNSTIDAIEIRFPGDANGNGAIPVNGTGGTIPPIADLPTNFKDVFGLRLGGDYNVLPDQLALRAGTFYETKAQNSQYQSLAFMGGQRIGLAAGGTYRIKLDRVRKNAIEVSLGYEHVFVGQQSNDNAYAPGVTTISGTSCNPAGNDQPGNFCTDGRQKYRVNWPTNLGTITNSVNVINIGVTYKF